MKDLKITPIRNGTVIDHLKPGRALRVLSLLGIPDGKRKAVSIAMFAQTSKGGLKDIVKFEDRELKPKEVNQLAILAPNATVNIIRDYKVAKKFQVKLPPVIEGIVKCENLNCITNQREPVESRLVRESKESAVYRCYYCGRIQKNQEKNII